MRTQGAVKACEHAHRAERSPTVSPIRGVPTMPSLLQDGNLCLTVASQALQCEHFSSLVSTNSCKMDGGPFVGEAAVLCCKLSSFSGTPSPWRLLATDFLGYGYSMGPVAASFRYSSGWDGMGVGLSLPGICLWGLILLFVFLSILQWSEICPRNMYSHLPPHPLLSYLWPNLHLSTRNQNP